jgi:YD repeat-containing protein
LRPAAHAQGAEQAGQLAISGRVERDARGAVARQCGAYFASDANAPCSADAGVTEDYRDPLGRLVRRLLPAGGEMLWVPGPGMLDAYDTAASQGQAEATRTFLDWRGRPAVVQLDPGGPGVRQFGFTRDPAGKVLERTSPLGAKVTAAYDGLGRLVTLGDPDTGTIASQYDGAGHPLARVDARGQRLAWAYDGAGRVLSESDPQGLRAQYCYDDPALCGAGSPSPGRLLRVADRSGSTAFGYDLDERMVSETVMQGGRALESSFEFDAADRLIRLHYPDGTSLDFGYGGRALVTSIPTLLDQATYSAGGLPLTCSFANGAVIDVTRDIADRAVGVAASIDGATVVGTVYSLSASGAPRSRVDLGGTTTFALDEAERLTHEAGPFGTRLEAFDEDDRLVGRWAVPPDARLPGQGLSYGQQAGPHALSASARGAISYDASGDRVSDGELALDWDAAGDLVGAESPAASARYVYGFDGSRRSRLVTFADGGSEAVFGFGDLVEVRDGVLWKHVVIQGERIASLLGKAPADTGP